MTTYTSDSVEETEAIAARLAADLHPGDVIALDGDLGAGKTHFVRGLVQGLGGDPRSVSSPTYVLLHIYGREPGSKMRLPVFHLDAYRTAGADDLESIGFDELLEQGGVTVVEWASRVPESLPSSAMQVQITATGNTRREICVTNAQVAG